MLPDMHFYTGIFLMVIGILVRQWAILILGRFFTLTISVQRTRTSLITAHIASFAIRHIWDYI